MSVYVAAHDPTSPAMVDLLCEARRIIREWPAYMGDGTHRPVDPVAHAAAAGRLREVNRRIHELRKRPA